ncbi:MAG TPA: hypothetical protein VLC92_18495 [Rhodocyclaceae bacterium]|nr:hypothetical protein [Rhodocyclaceae bacterium]
MTTMIGLSALVPRAPHLKFIILAMSLSAVAGPASAGPVRSVGSMTFADANTVIVADWVGGEIHALKLTPAAPAAAQPYRLKNISSPVAQALHVQPDALRFEDMAFRPGTELAYITLSVQRGKALEPALVSVDSSGKVNVINLAKTPQTSVAIKQRPTADQKFWNDIPAASYTVTDLVFNEGKLYVAGLSNASFASTLRVYDFPFNGKSSTTSIEMYHAVHNQVETRAPIRKMTIATLDGEPTLIAAYTCTPLVTVALKDLKDGAHIVGKTIAELGWGSAPVDMVTFDAGQGPMVLLTNSHKSADLMTLESIAAASKQAGLSSPIKWPSEPYLGVKAIPVPISGIARLGNQNKDFLGAMRRDEATGRMELVSIRKGAFLRVSDFINEYDFADFTYLPTDYFRGVHQVLRTDEGYPELAARSAP